MQIHSPYIRRDAIYTIYLSTYILYNISGEIHGCQLAEPYAYSQKLATYGYVYRYMHIVNDQRLQSQVLVAAIFHPLFVPMATTVYSSIFAYESPYLTVQQAGLGNITSDYDH